MGILYTRTGPVNIKYYDTVCSRGIAQYPYTKGAEEKQFLCTLLQQQLGMK